MCVAMRGHECRDEWTVSPDFSANFSAALPRLGTTNMVTIDLRDDVKPTI